MGLSCGRQGDSLRMKVKHACHTACLSHSTAALSAGGGVHFSLGEGVTGHAQEVGLTGRQLQMPFFYSKQRAVPGLC